MKSIYPFLSIVYLILAYGCLPNPLKIGESFNEEMYLFANPDVADLIAKGKYKSGLEHYTQVGQKTQKTNGDNYETFFTGTAGNDTVQGFGQKAHAHLTGVELELDPTSQKPFPLKFKNNGTGEIDVLIGIKEGGNEFILGSLITSLNPYSEPFYVGNQDRDYAKIENFVKSKDVIILAGKSDQYKWEASGNDMKIYTKNGDLIAIVEGVDKLEMGDTYKEMGIFTLK